jgi:DNA processing protein
MTEKLDRWIDLAYEDQELELKEIKIDDPEYPYLLKNVRDPPKTLFVKGNTELLRKPSVAIVGSRKPSDQGIRYAEKIAEFCVDRGFVVISGLALGVDTVAIKSALDSGGKVIAVLPTITKVVPKSNTELANKILKQGGLLIAENNRKTVRNYMFIKRNRIISGISMCVVVVETDLEGGTMHTVDYAKKQGRMIIVADLNANGNKKLIKDGYPVFNKRLINF